jgi:TonB family protein
MSSVRTFLCGLLGAFILVAGVAAQDLRETIGPLERQAKPITPENPIPRRTLSVVATYPAEARAIDATAIVTLVATLDDTGRVAEIRKAREPLVMSSQTPPPNPTALRIAAEAFIRDAASALRRWQYEQPASAPISFNVSFAFKPGAEAVATQNIATATPLTAVASATPTAAPFPPPPPGTPQPVRVGGGIKAPTQIKKVQPVYPAIAQSARVSGVVIMEALIGVDGRVTNAQVLRSIPLLDQAALDAVKQWEYTPTLLNGVPVPVIMTVTVTFMLPPPPQPTQ